MPTIAESLEPAAVQSALTAAGVPLKPSFAVTGPPGYEVARRIEFEVSKAEAAGAQDVAANLTAVQAQFKETPVAVPPPGAAAAAPAPAPAPAPASDATASATGPAAAGASAAAAAAAAADKAAKKGGAFDPSTPGKKVPAGKASSLSDGETAGVVVGSIAGAGLLGAGALALSSKRQKKEEETAALSKNGVSSTVEEAGARARGAAADVERAAVGAVERR
jgi:pyruvate dehydrogenase E2 component (dihydrolipoamide acetyltransferase)